MGEVTTQDLDDAHKRIDRLERLVQKLVANAGPTVPIMDQTNFPQDAVEGQVVIAPII